MTLIFKLVLLPLFLSAIFLFTNHQGVAQKVMQIFFLLMTLSVFAYIFSLRR